MARDAELDALERVLDELIEACLPPVERRSRPDAWFRVCRQVLEHVQTVFWRVAAARMADGKTQEDQAKRTRLYEVREALAALHQAQASLHYARARDLHRAYTHPTHRVGQFEVETLLEVAQSLRLEKQRKILELYRRGLGPEVAETTFTSLGGVPAVDLSQDAWEYAKGRLSVSTWQQVLAALGFASPPPGLSPTPDAAADASDRPPA
jgi:hypothetical protein